MHFVDLPYTWKTGHFGIIVRPEEVEIFRQFVQYHKINHGYANFSATLNRIRNKGERVVFYLSSPHTIKYYGYYNKQPHWMQLRSLSEMYESTIECADILELLS